MFEVGNVRKRHYLTFLALAWLKLNPHSQKRNMPNIDGLTLVCHHKSLDTVKLDENLKTCSVSAKFHVTFIFAGKVVNPSSCVSTLSHQFKIYPRAICTILIRAHRISDDPTLEKVAGSLLMRGSRGLVARDGVVVVVIERQSNM